MGEVIDLRGAVGRSLCGQAAQMSDLQLAIAAHERSADLFQALNHLSAHAGHVIAHLQEMLRDDPRISTPEWTARFHEYNKVWLNAQEALIPGISTP